MKKMIKKNLEIMWNEKVDFGMERSAKHIFIKKISRDRRILAHGFNIINNELQFDEGPAGADFTQPSLVTTLAHTYCGDRMNSGQPIHDYNNIVGTTFSNKRETGEMKIEDFSPAGGGTEDGKTLAHVAIAHAADPGIITRVCSGNQDSAFMYNFDLSTHVGKLMEDGEITFGKVRESPNRKPRPACGAVVGALMHYNNENNDHIRIKKQLGDQNYDYLAEMAKGERANDAYIIAASIVAIKGLHEVVEGIKAEITERGLAHLTAFLNINRTSADDNIIMLSRATLYSGEVIYQGLGTDATKYKPHIVDHHGEKRLKIDYGDGEFGLQKSGYKIIDDNNRHR